jgi:hypothetical protein
MVDSHMIAVTLGTACAIRAIAAVVNAASQLIQATSRLAMIVLTFFKKLIRDNDQLTERRIRLISFPLFKKLIASHLVMF